MKNLKEMTSRELRSIGKRKHVKNWWKLSKARLIEEIELKEENTMKLYVAYGSNLHKEQMAYRCPGAKIKFTGFVEDYSLVYRGSKTGAYATIIPSKGDKVPVAVWLINGDHEESLDIYEGFPTFYHKKDVQVVVEGGHKIRAMAYIMRDDAKPGYPTLRYLETCSQGYVDCGLDLKIFEKSIVKNQSEMLSEMRRSSIIAS